VIGALLGALIGYAMAPFVSVFTTRPPLLDAIEMPTLKFRCDSCCAPIPPTSAIPLFSFVVNKGRCRSCKEPISRWDIAAEIGSIMVGALIGWRIGLDAILPAFLLLGFVSTVVILVDFRLHRIATKMIYPASVVAFALLATGGLIDGDRERVIRAGIGGVAASAFLWLLIFIYPAGMGRGDARLVLLLGMFLGWHSWRHIYVGLLAGFLLGSIVGVLLIATRRGTLKTQIAFGPYLCIGAVFVALWPNVVSNLLQ
jgi:leader peptidase (prepilin peptidase) / N-methyltransferase